MAAGFRLGPFELAEPIGEGGMAQVWRGVHLGQQVPVAVKFVTGPWAHDPQYVETFRNEVRAVAGLDHPGIVMVFDHGEVTEEAARQSEGAVKAGTPYIVMELAGGGALDSLVLPLAWRDLKAVLLVLLDALAHAHARGVIHRDLKPANVLLCTEEDSRPGLKLTDFGIAHAMKRKMTTGERDEVTEGTPEYMAPEQSRALWRDYGPWTDLYALGCMAFEFATGDPPYTGPTPTSIVLEHITAPIPRLDKTLEDYPPGFEGWVHRLLQKDAKDRFRLAADAAWALAQLDGDDPAESSWQPGTEVLKSLAGGMKAPVVSFRDTTTMSHTLVGAPRAKTPSQALWLSDLTTVERKRLQGDGASEPAVEVRASPTVALCPRLPPPLPGTWARPQGKGRSMKLIGTGLGLWGLRAIRLVDRQGERTRMWQALGDAGDAGRARLILLHGGAGNGKSRLVEWFTERAHEVGGATTLRAFHSQRPGAAEGVPRMVAQYLQCVGLERAQILERAEKLLRAQGVSDAYEWNALTELMSPATEHDFAGGAQKIRFGSREEGYALVQRLLQRVTRERPAIVWLDDVHWSRDSMAFARYLMETQDSEPLPVVLVLTARDEALVENPDALARIRELKELRGVEELAVPVLAADDRAALVQELLGLEGELARQVQERTGGNPLFAVQLVNDWVQRGVLEVGETGFVLREGEEAVLPDDLYQVWGARIERLLEGMREGTAQALELAGVLGREVKPSEWFAICEHAGVEMDPQLVSRLFRERLAAPVEGGWVFTHAALRETLERMALESGRWADYHRAAVRMLRMEYPPHFPRMQERIGRHLFEAGDYEEALAPLLGGASNQRVAAQYRDAHDLLDVREEAMKRGGIPESDPRWGEGWALRSWIASNEGRIGDAWDWSEAAAVAARTHGWDAMLPPALLGMGVAARDRGELVKATELTEEAFGRFQKQKNRMGMAHCLQNLGVLSRLTGDLDWAQTQVVRALNLHEKIGNAFGTAQCKLRLAEAVMQRCEWKAAQELLREALHEFRVIAAPQMAALVINAMGDMRRMAGDLDAALTEYERARKQFVRLGSTSLHYANIGVALVALVRGDHAAAAQGLAAAREMLIRLERDGDAHRLSAGLMACAAMAGDWDEVVRWFADTATLRGEGAMVDRDVAGFAGVVGERAQAAGRLEIARDACHLELEQWQRLGERPQAEAAAGRMRAVLAALGKQA